MTAEFEIGESVEFEGQTWTVASVASNGDDTRQHITLTRPIAAAASDKTPAPDSVTRSVPHERIADVSRGGKGKSVKPAVETTDVEVESDPVDADGNIVGDDDPTPAPSKSKSKSKGG